MKKIIYTDQAPKPIGPYSVGVQANQTIYTAGQLGLDPKTNDFVPGGIEAETRQSLTNIKYILEAANSSMELVIKTTVFLRSMDDFPIMNKIYAEFFTSDYPARSTVQAQLPKGGAVEIEVVALVKE